MSATTTRSCPECGAINVTDDLFCKQCGASLAMTTGNYQHTAAFTPITSDQTGTVAIAPVPEQHTYQPTPAYTGAYTYAPIEESPRGAVLGWVAASLILIIIAFFAWAALISDSMRDRILGIF